MFGQTNPFGQTNSASNPFGSSSVFGQANNASNNPFAPKPFGGTTPFGSQPGTSLFGGTSTGVFGQPSTPMNSTTTFGASSTPAFGSSAPAFGASSTPAFGSSASSSFGGSSVFGQKPAFGGFGSTPTQTSPFGNSFQQSQPAFGSSVFGSSAPFGASSQPAFGATSSPAFGSSSTPAFGASSSPAFGATSSPAFGSTTNSVFGSGGAFGASSAPVFGSSNTPAFGSSSTPVFGASSAPAFGASSTPAFGASSTPAFGSSSTPSFNFGSTPAFGQSASAFGSSPFGSSTTPFGAQSSPFGAQTTTPAFGSTGFGQSAPGGQRGGSRVVAYTPTTEADGGNAQTAGKLESISAMPAYKDKSHEELRWEDYQSGDKGGPLPAGQSASGIGFNTSAPQSNPFSSTPSFAQTSANPFSSSTSANPFAPKTSTFGGTGFAASSSTFGSSPFGSSTPSNPFGAASSAAPSLFQTSTPAANPFGSNSTPSLFNTSSSSAFGSSPSLFGSGPAQGTTPAFGSSFGNTQSSGLFQSSPSLGQTGSAFGQTTTAFGQNSAPSFNQSSIFNTPSTGFGGMFSSTSSLISSNNQGGFGQATPAQPTQATGFGFNNFGQTQAAGTNGFAAGGSSSIFGQNNFGQSTATQSPSVLQPVPVTNPFGTLPAVPQVSIGRAGTAPSVQYGISSMPVVDKPAPVRISSLLTPRHLSQRRIRLPARKYHPKSDGPKVPFFSDDEETQSTPKADALFIPRENPRALVIRPTEQWPGKSRAEKTSVLKSCSTTAHENGKTPEETIIPQNGFGSEDEGRNLGENGNVKMRNQKPNGIHIHDDHPTKNGDSYMTLTGHRAGEAAIVYEHGADIEALMPKLRRSDYYTEPKIQELAAKERADPGFCRRVKDFVVGRQGYGSIMFLGETDVRRLDLESLVQFNNREVIVYMDDSKKPPVGQGLNKPAEVTLLNIKCFDKKSGKQCTEGAKVEKYKEMLKRKAEDQGATFVSYDPLKGEWKFRVSHFSKYSLEHADESDEEDLCGM